LQESGGRLFLAHDLMVEFLGFLLLTSADSG